MKSIEFIEAHQGDEDEKCECIILPDGSVEEPIPSHIGRLVALSQKESDWLHARMEKGMEPLLWLVQYTGCMAVWQTRVVSPAVPAKKQMDTLEELQDGAMLAPKYVLQKVDGSYEESVRRAKGQR